MACNRDILTEDPNDPWGLGCDPQFDLSDSEDDQLLESTITEPIEIAGAPINVFRLLGIHEQGKLIDLASRGKAISSSALNGSSSSNVFDRACGSWISEERGENVLTSFIGYDFGPIKHDNGVLKYGSPTSVYYEIGTIKIKQSSNPNRRATKLRIERSNNGKQWIGVDIVSLNDNAELQTVNIRNSAQSRYWRLRPIKFNGLDNDPWEVVEIQLLNYHSTNLYNMQDELGFMEARDRDYAQQSVPMKMYYDIIDARTELSKYGIDMSYLSVIGTISFRSAIRSLGRPFVIGDIIEIPSEAQYDPQLNKVKKWLEVTDVAWSTDGYLPSWKPVLQRLVLKPAFASQETMDIFPDIAVDPDKFGFVDEGADSSYQNLTNVHDRIVNSAKSNTPEKGFDVSDKTYISPNKVKQIEDDTLLNVDSLTYNPTTVYVEDAMPPNQEDFTEGDDWPINPTDGDYHRLTYKKLNDNIPPRLYRYSEMKDQWIYCETDRRQHYTRFNPSKEQSVNDNE